MAGFSTLFQQILGVGRPSADTRTSTIYVQKIPVTVIHKAVKHIRLSVHPPEGRVKLTVPLFMDTLAVRAAIVGRLDWIQKQRAKFTVSPGQAKLNFASGDTIYWLGQPYRLNLIPTAGTGKVVQDKPGVIDLYARDSGTSQQREALLYQWYRLHLKLLVPDLLAKWQPIVGVQAKHWGIKRMKTRWGTCNVADQRIWLNLELAKKPLNCIEYVLVHELVHLLERSHNARFKALLSQFMPLWPEFRKTLNQTTFADGSWGC